MKVDIEKIIYYGIILYNNKLNIYEEVILELFHYCSNKNFLSIIKGRKIYLSSLSLSNDTLEGKLVKKILIELSKNDYNNPYLMKKLSKSFSNLERIFDGLGFCLSENGDQLSQWRGYADDAAGVSIGFSKEYLERLSNSIHPDNTPRFSLYKVEYNYENQVELINPTYNAIKNLIDEGALSDPIIKSFLSTESQPEISIGKEKLSDLNFELNISVLKLLTQLFSLKTSAFMEESEWRLISYFLKIGNDTCDFHSSNNKIIPFREYKLEKLDVDEITKIIIGPKNQTPDYVISSLLEQNDFKNVRIKKSEASYR